MTIQRVKPEHMPELMRLHYAEEQARAAMDEAPTIDQAQTWLKAREKTSQRLRGMTSVVNCGVQGHQHNPTLDLTPGSPTNCLLCNTRIRQQQAAPRPRLEPGAVE